MTAKKSVMQVQSCGFARLSLLLFLRSRCRRHCRCLSSVLLIRPRANGSNIVGQQLPTLLNVICCVRLHTLLHVVACCWELLHPFAHYCNTDATTRNIVGATMLGVVASLCTPLQHRRNNTQHCWRNNVGKCCILLHVANTAV